jgi:hypothetical protein
MVPMPVPIIAMVAIPMMPPMPPPPAVPAVVIVIPAMSFRPSSTAVIAVAMHSVE